MISIEERSKASREVMAVELVCQSFKIGKTGQRVDDRYMNSDYPNIYNHIKPIFSGSKQDASEMESYLIDCYMSHLKCDNKKEGDASNSETMADDADKYYVYIVWE